MQAKPILYADDNVDDIFFMQQAFKELGLPNKLIAIENGAQTIEYLTGAGQYKERNLHPLPCLVLLDLSMPGISGLEILKWVRTQPAVSTLPVIVLTSSNHESDIHRAYAQGANGYLLKPNRPEKLVEALKTLSAFWLCLNQEPPDPSKFT